MKIGGIPVQEAKKAIILKVTQDDVSRANTKNPASCAAARCLLRKPGVVDARVHIGRTYVKLGKKWLRFRTAPALRAEIVAFDRGGTFEPGEYVLRPCSEW